VKCWGLNDHGELAEPSLVLQPRPIAVRSLDASRSVHIGQYFTCGLKDDGAMSCVGFNSTGQLGDGTFMNRTTFGDVSGLRASTVTTGFAHACALNEGGQVLCWGNNKFGQLGDGTKTNRALPTVVSSLPARSVKTVHAGENHTCARMVDETVKCWGANSKGQLGTGDLEGAVEPRAVPLPPTVDVALSADHTCALTTKDEVMCWGGNDLGQLGDGSTTLRKTPTRIL